MFKKDWRLFHRLWYTDAYIAEYLRHYYRLPSKINTFIRLVVTDCMWLRFYNTSVTVNLALSPEINFFVNGELRQCSRQLYRKFRLINEKELVYDEADIFIACKQVEDTLHWLSMQYGRCFIFWMQRRLSRFQIACISEPEIVKVETVPVLPDWYQQLFLTVLSTLSSRIEWFI